MSKKRIPFSGLRRILRHASASGQGTCRPANRGVTDDDRNQFADAESSCAWWKPEMLV
jgi:hypothetical protein